MSHTLSVALQLYTIKNETAKDYAKALTNVAELGYKGVELFNYGDYSAKELGKLICGLGLKAANTHVSLDKMETDPGRELEFALELGLEDLTIPRLPPERRKDKDDYFRFAETLEAIGELCHREGMRLHYHNHYYEFNQFDDMSGMDIIIGNTNPQNVFIELDTFWAAFSGVDPIDYMKKNAARIQMIHLKDMSRDKNKDGKWYSVEVGEGIMDMQGILHTCDTLGIRWAIVEQDACNKPELESVGISINYLKKTGWA